MRQKYNVDTRWELYPECPRGRLIVSAPEMQVGWRPLLLNGGGHSYYIGCICRCCCTYHRPARRRHLHRGAAAELGRSADHWIAGRVCRRAGGWWCRLLGPQHDGQRGGMEVEVEMDGI